MELMMYLIPIGFLLTTTVVISLFKEILDSDGIDDYRCHSCNVLFFDAIATKHDRHCPQCGSRRVKKLTIEEIKSWPE